MQNRTRPLAFENDFIEACLVENVADLPVRDHIVVNLSARPMVTGDLHPAIVPAWKSTWLKGGVVKSAERIALLQVVRQTNLGGLPFHGWDWLGNRIRSFPRDTPLYISPQDEIGLLRTDPRLFTNESTREDAAQDFALKLNLWWSPDDTDCFIHNEHPFLEIHTQIFGMGRMQKFHARNEATLYEEVIMTPGFTHDPFCRVTGADQWTYPWHRYFADTSAIWLAVELHPAG